jgi:hypothetical protein
MADEQLLAEANKVYKEYKGQGAKINDEEDFAVAYGLIKKPGGFVKAGKEEETAAYARAQQDALIRGRQNKGSGSDVAKFLEGGVTALKTGNADFINDYFKPWKAQTKTSTRNEAIGFENIEVLPNNTVKINYSIPINSGGVVIKRPSSRTLNANSSSLLQDITALHQELLGSDIKAERATQNSADKATVNEPKKFSATGKNGVKIFSSDGLNWFDKNGKKIQ